MNQDSAAAAAATAAAAVKCWCVGLPAGPSGSGTICSSIIPSDYYRYYTVNKPTTRFNHSPQHLSLALV